MNSTQLECFVSVASTLNFMKTAEQLSLSQPAVSRQIQSLESELGTRLFNRTTRSVTITAVGQRFLPEASRILQEMYRSREMIKTFQTREEYALRIGYSDPNEMYHISHTLEKLMETYDNSAPEFIMDQTDANLSKLGRGQVDLVLAEKDRRFADEDVTFTPMTSDSFVCIISRTHPLAEDIAARGCVVEDIKNHKLWNCRQILSIPAYLTRSYYSSGHSILPVNESVSNLTVANVNEAYCLVLAGLGYALVPRHLIIPNPGLLLADWKDTPVNSFGIYCRKSDLKEQPLISQYIKSAGMVYGEEFSD